MRGDCTLLRSELLSRAGKLRVLWARTWQRRSRRRDCVSQIGKSECVVLPDFAPRERRENGQPCGMRGSQVNAILASLQQLGLDRRRFTGQRRSFTNAGLRDAQLCLEIRDDRRELVGARLGEDRGKESLIHFGAKRIDIGSYTRFGNGEVRPLDIGARTERRIVEALLGDQVRVIRVVGYSREDCVGHLERERDDDRLILTVPFAAH